MGYVCSGVVSLGCSLLFYQLIVVLAARQPKSGAPIYPCMRFECMP